MIATDHLQLIWTDKAGTLMMGRHKIFCFRTGTISWQIKIVRPCQILSNPTWFTIITERYQKYMYTKLPKLDDCNS